MNISLEDIKIWASELGFSDLSVTAPHHSELTQERFKHWLEHGRHGRMSFFERNVDKRLNPTALIEGIQSVITLRMNYFPNNVVDSKQVLVDESKAYISRYALGRDYHKVLRNRLAKLADKINTQTEHNYRVFTDSAPVLEVALAQQSGLGWQGKHTLLINQQAGSFFFLGEIFTTLKLFEFVPEQASNEPKLSHCGSCTNCIVDCPTNAIIAPYQVDARKCISYLTIEHDGEIPMEYRSAMGNRIYGCDDCQLVCPWNRFDEGQSLHDFDVRHGLDAPDLLALWSWDETTFLKTFEGSPIRRIGYDKWQRNLAVALGNMSPSNNVYEQLQQKHNQTSALVKRHIEWAMSKHAQKSP